ncbi:hypothetical protein [Aeoliella mucimassa]|uniref:Uncharacterized protein n=1 Tax=Aeoliella mucimassa TaxID=2527972 RepID=A0A518AV36_9BACT|nr:hypothetical protein [Aeoliella mucimassa]QDU58578.1 hypothetical protein Pan181_48170 [Aeoliella mucimassa]
MSQTPPKSSEPVCGFLTVLEDPAAGMVGGLLVLDHRGRPLEFHCTTPIVPSRAEEILYGPTLRPHFYSERLGVALLAKASVKPALVVVNQMDCWQLADETNVPVVLVDPRPKSTQGSPSIDDSAPASEACLDRLSPDARPVVEEMLATLERYIDLAEPFERIEEAIRETGLLSTEEEVPAAEFEEPYDLAA